MQTSSSRTNFLFISSFTQTSRISCSLHTVLSLQGLRKIGGGDIFGHSMCPPLPSAYKMCATHTIGPYVLNVGKAEILHFTSTLKPSPNFLSTYIVNLLPPRTYSLESQFVIHRHSCTGGCKFFAKALMDRKNGVQWQESSPLAAMQHVAPKQPRHCC